MKPFQRTVKQCRADTEHGSGRLGDLMDGAVTHTGLNRRTDGELARLIAEEEGEISRAHHHTLHPGVGVERTLGHQAAEVDSCLKIIVQECISETYRFVAERLRSAAEYRERKVDIEGKITARPLLHGHRSIILMSGSRK